MSNLIILHNRLTACFLMALPAMYAALIKYVHVSVNMLKPESIEISKQHVEKNHGIYTN